MIRYIHYGITGLAPSLARCFQNEIILPFALFFHNSPQLLLLLSYVDRFLLSDSKPSSLALASTFTSSSPSFRTSSGINRGLSIR